MTTEVLDFFCDATATPASYTSAHTLSLHGALPVSLFLRRIKSNMTLSEMLIASDALHNSYIDYDRNLCIISAMRCDQVILGVIGDFAIQTDIVFLSLTYTEQQDSFIFSLRGCHERWIAKDIAVLLAQDIGGGGGHRHKAAGKINSMQYREKYGDKPIFDYFEEVLCRYIDSMTQQMG